MSRRRISPGPGQESVWDYPRPPRVEPSTERVRIFLGGELILETTDSLRVLETSHPPVYYLPRSAFIPGSLEPSAGSSFCEFKGWASYLTVRGGDAVAGHEEEGRDLGRREDQVQPQQHPRPPERRGPEVRGG